MILAGYPKMNFRSQILMRLGNLFKYVLPYLILYKLFAFVIMPKKEPQTIPLLFINEAKNCIRKNSSNGLSSLLRLTWYLNGFAKAN
jgi:hypothetical protein